MTMTLVYRDILDVSPEVQELVRQWRNSPEVRASMITQTEIPAASHRKWIEKLATSRETQQVRVAYFGETPIGVVRLMDIDHEAGHCDWGFYIGEPSFRGRGLGKAMLYEILRWAFDDHTVQRLFTSVLVTNPEALALYLKTGFEFEGVWRRHVRTAEGTLVDLIWVAMFREAWEARKADLAATVLPR